MILVLIEPEITSGASGSGDADAEGGLTVLSAEALTFALGVASTAGIGSDDVHAIAVGHCPPSAVQSVGRYGVGVLHHAEDPRLEHYSAAAWAACVVDAVHDGAPGVLIAPASPRGYEVLAHVAARLDLRMAASVTVVVSALVEGPETGDARLVVHRQVMGGSALEEVDLVGSPAILTMAGHAVEPAPVRPPVQVDVRVFSPSSITEADLVGQVRRLVPAGTGGGDLGNARVVVGGGRGVGGPDSFDELIALAARLGGSLGVSRVVTSLGWRPHHEQVGQTGSRITPDVYIPCGISGAIQHWAGCSSAKTIIAVNTDDEAPMVTKAHYAVIGDLHEVVPAINAELDSRG